MKQAAYMVLANGVDITAKIRDRLISLKVHDAAGIDSDTVTIELDNRDDAIALPPTGAALRVWIGPDDGLTFKGVYEVDELEEPLDDQALVIHAKAAKMTSAFKAPRDRTYDDITLGDLVGQIAKANGYESAVSEALAGVLFEHIDQRGESDMSLLTRLAKDRDAVFKPVADRLVIVPKAEAKSVSGKNLPDVTITDAANSSGRVTITEHNDYQSVVAYWFDEDAQERIAVTVGEGEPVFTMRQNHKSEETAQKAAESKLGTLQRGTASLSLTRPLSPQIMAEGHIVLSGHKASANRRWLVETAEHVIESGSVSYTSLSCATPKKEG